MEYWAMQHWDNYLATTSARVSNFQLSGKYNHNYMDLLEKRLQQTADTVILIAASADCLDFTNCPNYYGYSIPRRPLGKVFISG